jgi:hypothetical protein
VLYVWRELADNEIQEGKMKLTITIFAGGQEGT